MSYIVAQRSRELAGRAALGARRSDIVRLVLRDGLFVTGIGIGAGVTAAMSMMRFIAALLYGVTPTDPTTYVSVPLLLALMAALASLVPARRAARIDPLRALRGGV